MKYVINMVIVLLISIAFAACQKTNDPVSPNDITKANTGSIGGITDQASQGSFEVTFKNYKNTDQTMTIRGRISFIFEKSTYSYIGEIFSTEEPTATQLHDKGIYSINGDVIKLADDATKMASAQWLPSLYLSGDYRYSHVGDITTIEGTGRFGSIKITLKTPATSDR